MVYREDDGILYDIIDEVVDIEYIVSILTNNQILDIETIINIADQLINDMRSRRSEAVKDYTTISHYLSGKEYDDNIKETVERLVVDNILTIRRTESNLKYAKGRLRDIMSYLSNDINIVREVALGDIISIINNAKSEYEQ